jgi:dipeptidyl-peptidase-4
MILIACNSNQIFRHSFTGLLFIQYCYKGTDKAVRFPSTEPTFSPEWKDCLR